MNIIIREYDRSDIHVFTKIFNEVVNEGNAFLTEKPVTETQMKSRLEHDETATYAMLFDGKVIGGYMLKANLKGRGSHIGNATYFVSKASRQNGFGYLLGKHSLEKAKALGFHAMQFNSVVSNNEASIRLWKKLDFQTIGVIPHGFRLSNGNFADILILYRAL